MSNTGDQNDPFPVPQPPAYGPPPAPQPPVPAQQNPYAHPLPQGPQGPQNPPGPPPGAPSAPPRVPGGYGYPTPGTPGVPGAAYGAPPGGGPGVPPGALPVALPGIETRRQGTAASASGWLWAVGGAVAATAIGASVLFATGAFSSEPDPELKGYAYRSDLCAATSLTPFESAGYKAKPSPGGGTGSGSGTPGAPSPSSPPNPQHSGTRMNSMDSMWCNVSLAAGNTGPTAGYSSTWIYSSATLHKKADPAPEFADIYRSYEKQQTSIAYKVEPVSGIGDEAYLITRNDAPGSNNNSYVILAVRDGWMTYQSTWSSYTASSSGAKPPTPAEIATMLETSAKETLQQLQR
ncbi:hypothetical protein [Streptomyces sp. WZ-12]|uniref:hypothetical protein n=1 Tax=Streptomyces sp. WZ-12 TaxID=3030210 RepID=UPI00238107F2|nr:hypothetical protein [Streptomyces sp. WZ-12]